MRCNEFLKNVAEFQKGYAFKSKDYQEYGRKIVKVSNLTENSIDLSGCICIDEDKAGQYERYELVKDDIIITTVGSWPTNPASVVGKVVRVREEADNSLLNQNAVRVRGNDKVNQGYLYYLLKNNLFKSYIVGTAQGSASQASITQEDIKNFEFELHSKEEQIKITETLSAIDDKIELNNEMNKTLEEMAQTLFKRWFIDFEFPNEDGKPYKSSGGEMFESELGMIPKGWSVLTLDDLCVKITDGSHFSPKHCKSGVYPMLSVKDMRDYGFDYQSCKKIDEDDYKKMINNDCVPKINDILVAKDGSYLKHIFIMNEEREEAILSSIAIFRPNTNVIYSEVLLNMLKQPLLQKKVKENYVSGSAVPRIVLKDFKKLQVIVPTMCVQNKIIEVLKAYRSQILINTNQNESLIILRDSLLPKLMSREIRVEDIEANL